MSGAGASEKNVPSWYEGSWQGLGQRDTIPLLEQQEVRPRAPIPKDEMGAASLEKKSSWKRHSGRFHRLGTYTVHQLPSRGPV